MVSKFLWNNNKGTGPPGEFHSFTCRLSSKPRGGQSSSSSEWEEPQLLLVMATPHCDPRHGGHVTGSVHPLTHSGVLVASVASAGGSVVQSEWGVLLFLVSSLCNWSSWTVSLSPARGPACASGGPQVFVMYCLSQDKGHIHMVS